MAAVGLGAILIQDTLRLRRTFRAWQQEKEIDASGMDNEFLHIDSADRDNANFNQDTLEKDKINKYPEDEDYQNDIERFKTAEAALAKFERASFIDEVEEPTPTTQLPMRDLLYSQLSSNKQSRKKNAPEDSYYQLSEWSNCLYSLV